MAIGTGGESPWQKRALGASGAGGGLSPREGGRDWVAWRSRRQAGSRDVARHDIERERPAAAPWLPNRASALLDDEEAMEEARRRSPGARGEGERRRGGHEHEEHHGARWTELAGGEDGALRGRGSEVRWR